MTRNRLVFNQKAKLIEVNQHFKIRVEEGNEVGEIVQEGESKLKKIVRFVGSVDRFMTPRSKESCGSWPSRLRQVSTSP